MTTPRGKPAIRKFSVSSLECHISHSAKALARAVLASGRLGTLNGLPATIIVTIPLQDLQSATGVGVTAGGTLLPMREVIRLAAQAHHYLVI